jgi:hypothetical protein
MENDSLLKKEIAYRPNGRICQGRPLKIYRHLKAEQSLMPII